MLKANYILASVMISAALMTMYAAPVRLRCESLTNALGSNAEKPSPSWQCDTKERHWKGTAFQILVASRVELLSAGIAAVWDVGTTRERYSVSVDRQSICGLGRAPSRMARKLRPDPFGSRVTRVTWV
jgi:hypothetical protein